MRKKKAKSRKATGPRARKKEKGTRKTPQYSSQVQTKTTETTTEYPDHVVKTTTVSSRIVTKGGTAKKKMQSVKCQPRLTSINPWSVNAIFQNGYLAKTCPVYTWDMAPFSAKVYPSGII